jgi:hypothetical protein
VGETTPIHRGRARTLYSAEVTAATRREVAVTTWRPAPRTALVLRAPRGAQVRAFIVAMADIVLGLVPGGLARGEVDRWVIKKRCEIFQPPARGTGRF